MMRTRIKFCGITRAVDLEAAAASGADAVGFVCYERSPRYVSLPQLRELARALPPFLQPVLLFVNAPPTQVTAALELVPQALLQFHGDEDPEACARHGRPFIRAVRMRDGVDLLDCERRYAHACALLADAPTPGYGGSGASFEWSRLPPPSVRRKALVLAGGLTPENVGAAIGLVRPYAVDVSSGIEDGPGVKSAAKMRRFVAAVRATDAIQ
ncbi:MAG: phosphoribosylanthranilate isomerase [Sutterellaceae bacterium]|nr:phosphoribosylanthranilate isomerase [Burkholderiaceae bacterium]MCX7901167.1 phosphoribosylanthranilate isomerase [Burkholderiaceae bacterium]MDW8430715.1 phosphoribosylanthranilate isomerase [Sutterellaceae bacterium]